MRTYGQYCPISRASEIFAERWTPLIIRNVLNGSHTFTEIANGAPGLSRTLLTTRLRQLERAGVIQTTPTPSGRGSLYFPTEAGRDLMTVMKAMGAWGERWIELSPHHLDPGFVLHAWVHWYLELDRLPDRRVVARFHLPALPGKTKDMWVLFDGERSEICRKAPGFEEDLVIEADARALAEWHLGRIEWIDALREELIRVQGPSKLARALPTWNRRSEASRVKSTVSAN